MHLCALDYIALIHTATASKVLLVAQISALCVTSGEPQHDVIMSAHSVNIKEWV